MKKSINSVQIVGTLKEINLSREGVQTRQIGYSDKKTVQCNRISKTEFKNPAFTIDVNGHIVEVDVSWGVDEKTVDKDGNVIDNPKYKTLETVLNTYECGSTRVKVDGTIAANEYVTTEGEYKTLAPKVELFTITHNNVPDEDYSEGSISGIIAQKRAEFVNEEETGRKFLRVWSFDYKGSTFPVDLVIPADLVDDFENLYETNSQAKLDIEIVTVQHGAKNTTTTGFGRKSKRTAGYTTTEFHVIGGDEPFEEENEYFITPEEVRAANDERDVMIEKRIAKRLEKSNGSTPTVSGASSNVNPFGGTSNPFGDITAVELPF